MTLILPLFLFVCLFFFGICMKAQPEGATRSQKEKETERKRREARGGCCVLVFVFFSQPDDGVGDDHAAFDGVALAGVAGVGQHFR